MAKPIKIKRHIYKKIIRVLERKPIESGGIIGIRNNLICKFYFDGHTSNSEYSPDTVKLNKVILSWFRRGIDFAGIAHSHPEKLTQISVGDLAYAHKIKQSSPHIELLIIIVVAKRNNSTSIRFYDCITETEIFPKII